MYIELYKNQKIRSMMERDAFQYLVTDLLNDSKRGESKQMTVNSSYMENKFSEFAFVPSMFYTFLYTSNISDKSDLNFIDRVPIILCTESNLKQIKGFNFNFLPNNIRAIFLDILTKGFGSYGVDQNNNEKLNDKMAFSLSNKEMLSYVVKYIESKTNININNSLRQYDRRFVVNPRMIEPSMWEYIPFLNFKDAVRGINLAKIQTETIKQK